MPGHIYIKSHHMFGASEIILWILFCDVSTSSNRQ